MLASTRQFLRPQPTGTRLLLHDVAARDNDNLRVNTPTRPHNGIEDGEADCTQLHVHTELVQLHVPFRRRREARRLLLVHGGAAIRDRRGGDVRVAIAAENHLHELSLTILVLVLLPSELVSTD